MRKEKLADAVHLRKHISHFSSLISHFRRAVLFFLFPFSFLLLTGCQSLKQFMARDLEDEDFIIGQLYVDEVVQETPVINRPVEPKPKANPGDCSNALGLKCNDEDNALLYEAVNLWLGVPYRYGGTDRTGIDCSAFVGTVYKEVYGVTLHRSANDMLRDVTLISRDQLKEGDLIFFTNSKGKVSHVGIYLKEGLFAHSSTSNGVSVSRLTDTYWSSHFYRGGRVKK